MFQYNTIKVDILHRNMNWKKAVPNLFTLSNLLFGCMSILFAAQGNFEWAVFCILFGAIADVFDGAFARALNVAGPLGVQLDSLADMVTFGVAPGMLLYYFNSEIIVRYYQDAGVLFDTLVPTDSPVKYIPYLALFIPAFSALRLAKFNIDTEQTTFFKGLPTPANALVCIFFPMYYSQFPANGDLDWVHPLFIAAWCVVGSLGLVVNTKLLSLKFSGFGLRENLWRYVLIAGGALSILISGWLAIPIILLLYLLTSILHFSTQEL